MLGVRRARSSLRRLSGRNGCRACRRVRQTGTPARRPAAARRKSPARPVRVASVFEAFLITGRLLATDLTTKTACAPQALEFP
jgi:hypothetical protein